MTDHARARELAAIAVDFDLTVDERAELDTHLESCATCRAHVEGLRLDARALTALPRRDAPERVRRRVAPDRRPGWGIRPRLVAAAVAVVVVVAFGVAAWTGGLRFEANPDVAVTQPTTGPVVSGAPAPSRTPESSLQPSATPATSLPPATSAPGLPKVAWVEIGDQSAFDPAAVTPKKDTSKPPPPCGVDCGDTSVFARRSVVRAAVETDAGIVAVGHGCVGGTTVTCQADVWLSSDGRDWEAVPNDGSLDTGSDTSPNRPTGMMDVVIGPRGLVAGGVVARQDGARDGGARAAIWVSADGRRWQRTALDHEGDGLVTALAAGPTAVVAAGRVRTDDGVVAAVWVSPDGTSWVPATEIEGAGVGRFDGDEELVAGIFDVTWAGERFVAVGAACSSPSSCGIAAWTSPDGRSWARSWQLKESGRLRSVAYLGPRLVAVGDDGNIGRAWTSIDATEWDPAEIELPVGVEPATLNAVVAVGAGAIAAGDGYAVQSVDGRSWHRSDDDVLADGTVYGLAAGSPGFVATGQLSGDFKAHPDGDEYLSPPAIWVLPYR